MRTSRIGIGVWSLVVACGGATTQPAHPAQSTAPTLEDVAWVIGSWEAAPDEHGCTYHEDWHRESSMLFTGHGHAECTTQLAEQDPFEEDLRIEADDSGLVYVAWPTGQDRTEFPFTSGGTSGFVAENPDHDFPTRIEYQHTANGIDALISGPTRRFTLSMHPSGTAAPAPAADAGTP
jgi:hypothetical protein